MVQQFVQKCQYYYISSDQSVPLATVMWYVSLMTKQLCFRPLKNGDVIYGRPFSLSCTWEFFIWKRGRGNKFFIDHTHSQLISSHNVAKKILKSKSIFPTLVFSVSFLNKNMINWRKRIVKSQGYEKSNMAL